MIPGTALMQHSPLNIASAISLVALLTFCSESEELPCADLPAIGIETLSTVKDSLFKEDTFLVSASSEANVTFSVAANGRDYTSLAWQIGDDPRTFTEPTFNLWFDKRDTGTLNVELTMQLRPSECFPNDSIISLKKIIRILAQENTPYAFEGTFTGYNESEPDRMFDITIVNFGPFPPPSDSAQYWLHVYNLTEGCGGEKLSVYKQIPGMEQASYQHFYINESATARTNCPEIRGYGRIDMTGILTVDYSYRTLDTWEERSNRFVGTRKPS